MFLVISEEEDIAKSDEEKKALYQIKILKAIFVGKLNLLVSS